MLNLTVRVFHSYELNNGQFFGERGYLKEDGSQVKEGSYGYIDPNGNKQGTNYTSDDTGYHPIVGKKTFELVQFHFIHTTKAKIILNLST